MGTRSRQPPSLTVLHWNINSYTRRQLLLQTYVALHPVDIVCLNELRTAGSNCYRDDTRYGGVAIFIKKGIKHRRLAVTQRSNRW